MNSPAFKIAASVLNSDLARLGEEATAVLAAGADMIHLDVMDNHYVPNLTLGPMFCQALRKYNITAPIDVHLMVKPANARLIEDFAKAGATYITIHPEASEHIDRSIQIIHDNNCKAGLAFNPATPLNYLDHLLDKLDLILIMSVNPGFGGQEFIPSALEKIKKVREILTTQHHQALLAVDGGVKLDNITEIAKAGANTFIIGSAIFKSNIGYKKTILEFKTKLKKNF